MSVITDPSTIFPDGAFDPHPDYSRFLPVWNRIHDCMAGADAVKSNAKQYIPMTSYQKEFENEYDATIARTSFINFPDRARDGVIRLIFRKDQTVTVLQQYKVRLENINNGVDNATTFIKRQLMKSSHTDACVL
jgi:hypothetical protein